MTHRSAVILGAGGHARSLAETVTAAGYLLKAFVSDGGPGAPIEGIPVLGDLPDSHVNSGGSLFIGVGDNSTRQRLFDRTAQRVPLDQLPPVVHPSASVARSASVGSGSVVLQGAVVGAAVRIGTGCLLNSGSILEHNCVLGDFASLAPGVAIGGAVVIGRRSAISIGAAVKHGLTIGDDTVIGAASYVNSDIPGGVVAYGVPARTTRGRDANDPYLT